MKAIIFVPLIISLIIITGCSHESKSILSNESNNDTNQTNPDNETIDINVSDEEINNSNNETINISNESTDSQTCIDTDNGKIYVAKGTTIVSNGRLSQVTDYCEDTSKLIEYYCKEDNKLGIEIYSCSSSANPVCSDGACGGSLNNNSNSS